MAKPELLGEIKGLKEGQRQRLLEFFSSSGCSSFPWDQEYFAAMAQLTEEIGKEIGVLLEKQGRVRSVIVGDHRSISLPADVEIQQRAGFLHTHPGGSGELSDLDITALEKQGYFWIAAIGVRDGKAQEVGIAFRQADSLEDPRPLFGLWPTEEFFSDEVQRALVQIWQRPIHSENTTHDVNSQEKVLLAGLELPNSWPIEESLLELKELVRTAGGEVVGQVWQKRSIPVGATFVGVGKLHELSELVQVTGADTVVFDDELSGVQQRNIESLLGCKVLDRTALILDIFAQRARSHEGKIQVELAQLKYQMTRLTGHGISMSRLGGGIGTRGPGETKLEVDRRRIRRRITQLEQSANTIQDRRTLRREDRTANEMPLMALVGYTNAGKSTLMNRLTDSDVLAEDKLFATLDPTVRRLDFSSGRTALISDTVGFINKLPHKLVNAFRATLEELNSAQVLLHVIDVSDPAWKRKQEAVQKVLDELKLPDQHQVFLYNKMDQVKEPESLQAIFEEPGHFGISAQTGEGLEAVIAYLENLLFQQWKEINLLFSYAEMEKIHQLHQIGRVLATEYQDEGVAVKVELPLNQLNRWESWLRK